MRVNSFLAMLAATLFPAVAMSPQWAQAQEAATLKEAVRTALLTNPQVNARWHAFQAAIEEQDVARGGYYPRVDAQAGAGYEWRDRPDEGKYDFSREGGRLSLSQMIYDGFATRDEVASLNYSKLARYYEVLDASETTALEATRAYMDVLKYRELVSFAQENYDQHKHIFDQVERRSSAGVGPRADLEQARGRLALAESNLMTEISNLHDVSARYLRVIGNLPPETLDQSELPKQVPGTVTEALRAAYQTNPAFNAAVENVRAAQADIQVKKSAYHPRLDLRASQDLGWNIDNVDGRRNDRTVELVLSYNLFNGGSDSAAKRQAIEAESLSENLRENTCREVRQNLSIAYNDVLRLQKQLEFLQTHQDSIGKVRDAARKQYDIGQRTLLDLLDTENEYFQARRDYTEGAYNFEVAYARTYAAMGELMHALQVSRDGLPNPEEAGQDRNGVDPSLTCPLDAPTPMEYSPPKLPEAAVSGTETIQLSSYFGINRSELSDTAKRQLDVLANRVHNNPEVTRVVVQGHADSTGSLGLNQGLSQRRANAVKNYLVSRGVAESMIDVEAYGKTRPITENETRIGRTQNRRVETEAEMAPEAL